MTQITYFIGQTVEARKRLLREEVATKGAVSDNTLHIVPTRRMVTEREAEGNGWPGRPVDTLSSIIGRIFYDDISYQSFTNSSYMDGTMRELAIKVILDKRSEMTDGLQYFSPLFTSPARHDSLPGIYQRILGFFSLLVSNNFEDGFVDLLSRRITLLDDTRLGAGEERYALDADLALLFGDYEEFKRSNGLYDNDDILSSVRSFLAGGKSPTLLKDTGLIIFDGYITITKAEEEILFHLFKNVDEILWLLDFDPRVNDPVTALREASGYARDDPVHGYEAFRIFASLVSLMERVEQTGPHVAVKKAPAEEFKNPFAAGLYRSGSYDQTKENGLKIKSFHTRLDEIRGIAGEIKRIYHQGKMDDLSGIRVLLPFLPDYASLINEIFPEYGIPFNIAKGFPLVSSPLSMLFQLIIAIPLNDYRREDLQRFFSSSLVSPVAKSMTKQAQLQGLMFLENNEAFFAGETKEDVAAFFEKKATAGKECRFDISLADSVGRQCSIKGGKILTDWLPQARNYFFFLYRNSPDERKRDYVLSEYYSFLQQLIYLNDGIKPFEDLLSRKTPKEIVQSLFSLLDLFEIQENILLLLKDHRGLQAEVIEGIIKREMQTFRALKDLAIRAAGDLDKAESYLVFSKNVPPLERFKRVFSAVLAHASTMEDRCRGAVDISEWPDIIGCSFEYVFAGGLSADAFPFKEPDDFILPESSGAHLRKMDLIDQSRHLFSHILCNCRKDLYLSYPRIVDNKDVQPSPVLLDMLSMADNGSTCQTMEELERLFCWEENPYFTAREEFLNAIEVEKRVPLPPQEYLFAHEHIILGDNGFLNESVIRGIRTSMARNVHDGLSEYDGLVSSSPRFPHYLTGLDEIFSTSRLDMMANCPLRYLFRGVYSLEPIEEVEEGLSLRDIGSHIHALLKMIFDELRANGENVASVGLSRAFALAREIGDRYFSHLKHAEGLDFFETQKRNIMEGLETTSLVTEKGFPKREGLLARILRFEEQNLNKEQIIALEHGFGESTSKPVTIGGTRIRGYIDRVDKLSGAESSFLIYDYKTGRPPALAEIKKGLSFQLPGYLAALAAPDVTSAVARYYLTTPRALSDSNPLTPSIAHQPSQKTGIDLTGVKLIGDYADDLIGLLKRGIFHHSTDEMTCAYCEFKYACHKNSRRMSHLVDAGVFPELYSGRKNMERWKEVEDLRKRWKGIQKKMSDSLKAKKEKLKRVNFEAVMEFKEWLRKRRHSLPFEEHYIDQIIKDIDTFERAF